MPDGRRLAVIVNEFGDVGIDGEILKSCGIESCPEDAIVELANGCICCTVADDFVPALKSLLDRPNPPEHIVIETSGLALPKPLVQGVQLAGDRLARHGRRRGDGGRWRRRRRRPLRRRSRGDRRAARQGPSLDHDNPLEEVFEDQLLCADLVILEQGGPDVGAERRDVTGEIGRTLPRVVKVVEAQNGQVPIAVLLASARRRKPTSPAGRRITTLEGEHDHDDFDTFIVEMPSFDSPQALVDRIARATAAHDILRMKGFVDIAGKPMRLLVQGVGARLPASVRPRWRPARRAQGRLVVIGEKGLDKAGIEALIRGLTMHVLATQLATLEEADVAVDLGQSPAEMVVLSFSDSDLSALAAAWQRDADIAADPAAGQPQAPASSDVGRPLCRERGGARRRS